MEPLNELLQRSGQVYRFRITVLTMKRYQNPYIFEHLYLRAVTNAYQQQFAPLAILIPAEPPPARVWKAIRLAAL